VWTDHGVVSRGRSFRCSHGVIVRASKRPLVDRLGTFLNRANMRENFRLNSSMITGGWSLVTRNRRSYNPQKIYTL